MRGFQLLAVTLFALAFSRVVADTMRGAAELTDMFEQCRWVEAQQLKDITVAEISRDCRDGFSVNFDLATYNAVLKLVDCRGDKPDWVISLNEEISLSIGENHVMSRPHPLYGPTEYLRMHLEYSHGYLAVSSHGRTFLEFRAMQEDGADPTFCAINLGQNTQEAKIVVHDTVCINMLFPRPIVVQPDVSRNTMRPIYPGFRRKWMMRCKVETTRNFLFILRQNLDRDGPTVVVDATNDEVAVLQEDRVLQSSNFLDQMKRNDILEILLIENDGKLVVLFTENDESPVFILRANIESEEVKYISYRTHGMEGRFTCYDPQEAIEIRIIEPPPPPPPSPTSLPSTTFPSPLTTEPIPEMECNVADPPCCLWYENRPTGTPSLLPDILTNEMKVGISMKISISARADCDAKVIIDEIPGQTDGLVLGFKQDALTITYKDVLCREPIDVGNLFGDENDPFVHFELKFSNGFGYLRKKGPFPMITWNTGEPFTVGGISIQSTCESTKFVLDPQPWGPPEIFGVIWEVGPVFIPEYPLPPLIGECSEGFELPFEAMCPEGFSLLLQSGPSAQEVILSVGVYHKTQVWVKDTILFSQETNDLFTPGVFTKFVLMNALDRVMLFKVDPATEKRHVVLAVDQLPTGLSIMGFAAVNSIAQLRFQRCRKIKPIDIRIIPPTEKPPIITTTPTPSSSSAAPSSTMLESSTITTDRSTTMMSSTSEFSSFESSTKSSSTQKSTTVEMWDDESSTPSKATTLETQTESSTKDTSTTDEPSKITETQSPDTTSPTPSSSSAAPSSTMLESSTITTDRSTTLMSSTSEFSSFESSTQSSSTQKSTTVEMWDDESSTPSKATTLETQTESSTKDTSTTDEPSKITEAQSSDTTEVRAESTSTDQPWSQPGASTDESWITKDAATTRETGQSTDRTQTTTPSFISSSTVFTTPEFKVPTIANTPLLPSGENGLNELPEDRVPVDSNGDGIFKFNALRSFDITNPVFFEFSVDVYRAVWIDLSPTDSYQPNGYLIGLNIDGDYTNVIQRCQEDICTDSGTSKEEVLNRHSVFYVEINSIFDKNGDFRSLRIRFGYSINQVHTDILDFTDDSPLWISYAGFCTRDNFVGHFLIFNFLYGHGTMLRTFFQTNIHSYSVATSPLESNEKQITFGVKAEKSVVVALSASSSPSGPHYNIEIGAENNMKTVIKQGGTVLAEVDSKNILDPDNYVEFWISFKGEIRIGKAGSQEFLSFKVDNLPAIRYAFFQSGSHEKGSIYYWFVYKYFYFSQAMGKIFSTHDEAQAYQYHYTELRREGGGAYIEFQATSTGMILVALSPNQGDSDGMIEVGIGAYNNRYIIVKDCRECKPLKMKEMDFDLLDPENEKHFVITVIDNVLRVFKKDILLDGGDPMFEWNYPLLDETFFNYMGFSGSFMAHFHFHVYMSFEYKYYQIEPENIGKKLHLGITASRDACIAIAGENPDDSKLFEIVIAPQGMPVIQINLCKGCAEVARYEGEILNDLLQKSKTFHVWIQVSQSEFQMGAFDLAEGDKGRSMHDQTKFLSVPNTLGITACFFGIASGEEAQSHWFLYPYV